MGEYAKRRSDAVEIKIGTCESMYYLRYEDRNKVEAMDGNINPSESMNLRWRLPLPDEDNVLPGEYEDYNRAVRLYNSTRGDFRFPESIKNTGIIQLTHPIGLLVNETCYHGEKLPDSTDTTKYHWNGKTWSWALSSVKNTKDGIKPIISCRWCNMSWFGEWVEIIDYIPQDLKDRCKKLGYF